MFPLVLTRLSGPFPRVSPPFGARRARASSARYWPASAWRCRPLSGRRPLRPDGCWSRSLQSGDISPDWRSARHRAEHSRPPHATRAEIGFGPTQGFEGFAAVHESKHSTKSRVAGAPTESLPRPCGGEIMPVFAPVAMGPGSAAQRDRTMRSLSSGARSRDPLASPGGRSTASGTRAGAVHIAVARRVNLSQAPDFRFSAVELAALPKSVVYFRSSRPT
jgi:hypothetical protein